MKARGMLVLALMLSLAIVPVLASAPARAAGTYTEQLNVYTAGSSAYWQMTFSKLNSSLPNLSTAESTAGLTSYRLVAMSTQAATTDLQIFGVDGYNILGVPSYPSEGLFITLNATSSSAALPVVSYFADRFGTSFTLVSSGSGSFVYYAPVDFVGLAAPVLYRLVPTTMKGFASFMTESTFVGLTMPSIEINGVYNGTGFSHTITIGAAATSVVSSGTAISIPAILGDSSATLTSSSSASSSEVVVHALDGVIQSTDKAATVSNDTAAMSGTYTLPVSPGAKVDANVTVFDTPVTAIAYRLFDRGSLSSNQTLGVTIVVKDTAQSGSITNVAVNDDWWKADPSVFSFVSGNYSFDISTIAAGQNMTESYYLQVVTSSSMQVTIPSATATFQYLVSSTEYTGEAALGQAVLQVNQVGPAISVVAKPTLSSGAALGTAGNYTITIANIGSSPALDVRVAGTTYQSIVQGGSQTVNVPIALANLAENNITRSFSVEFTNSAVVPNVTQNVTSDSVSLDLSHAGMVIPQLQVYTNDSLSYSSLSSRALNVTYTIEDSGTANAGSLVGSQTFPAGVTCKVVKAGNNTSTCSGSAFTVSASALTTSGTRTATVQLSFARDNYVIYPPSVAASYEGATLHGFGSAYLVPAGITLTKAFALPGGFPGMTSSVTLGVENIGTVTVYNATLISTQDTFDAASGTLTHTYSSLAPKQPQTLNYTVEFGTGEYGNESSSVATVSMVFGGIETSFSSGPAYVQLFQPVSASVTTVPSSPEESHDFTLSVTFVNNANVTVSDVTYTATIPSGLTVVSGGHLSGHTLTISVPSLGPEANQTASVIVSASMGLTINLVSSHVSFEYMNSSLLGTTTSKSIGVGVDVTTRYTLPIALAILIAVAGLVYVRRRASPSVEN